MIGNRSWMRASNVAIYADVEQQLTILIVMKSKQRPLCYRRQYIYLSGRYRCYRRRSQAGI